MMLDNSTRAAASVDFGGLPKTPRKAITMGVSSILSARRVVLLAWGERKAPVIRGAVEGLVTELNPASYLQTHPNALFVIDEAAASELTRMKTPWLVDSVVWDNKMKKKAVTYLSLTLSKPILKLTDRDYNDNGMSDLLAQYGQAYDINIDVFNQLQHTITGWPGGKPNADDTNRPERALPAQKRCLIFADYVVDFNTKFGIESPEATRIFRDAAVSLREKKDSEMDTAEVRYVKGLIRMGEAKSTCRFVGVPVDHAHFLNMPFYETGTVAKKPLSEADIKITMALIEEVKPHQIYAAGDLADPHGTHKVCLDAVLEAVRRLRHKNFMKDCWVWLYRGAWAEWDIHEIEMAVPMSPDQVMKKRLGIFKHQSQKDGVVYQGTDSREFWQRAEERNRATAALYNRLGLAEYEAMEAFVRWKG